MPTPGLRELQGLFWRSISRAPGTLQPTAALLEVTEPGATRDPAARLSIYADAYFWRLRDVLLEDFPRVAAILGPNRFDALVCDHLGDHPSTDPSISHVGRELAATIADRSYLPPYLADLARLERARVEVFAAPDSAVLAADGLRQIPTERWPALRLSVVPALNIVRAEWPVHRLWNDEGTLRPEPSPTFLRVWRDKDCRVFHAALDRRELGAFERMVAGEPLETICAAFADLPPVEAGHQAVALIARWLEDGIIARLVLQ